MLLANAKINSFISSIQKINLVPNHTNYSLTLFSFIFLKAYVRICLDIDYKAFQHLALDKIICYKLYIFKTMFVNNLYSIKELAWHSWIRCGLSSLAKVQLKSRVTGNMTSVKWGNALFYSYNKNNPPEIQALIHISQNKDQRLLLLE